MGRVRRFLYTFPWGKATILWALVIFYFSSLPGSSYPVEVTPSYYLERKGAHVFEYCVLTLLLYGLVRRHFPQEKRWAIALLALFGSTLYGISDELHQYFTPFRGAKITDVGIDIIGGLLALITLYGYYAFLGKKTKKPLTI